MGTISTPPCYKYLARNLSNPDERYAFTRHFFEKLKSTGADLDDCLVLYSSLDMPDSAGGRYTYNDVSLDPQGYYEQIMKLDGIPSLSCPQYYRGIMKPDNRNNVCQLCELSKSFKNGNYDTECALIKYAAQSKENYERFSALGVNGIFKYCIDIASELSADKPAIVPILAIAYSYIENMHDEFFLPEGLKERLEKLVGKIAVEATTNPNVKTIQMQNHKALPISWEIVIDTILDAKELNYDEVCSEVSKIDLSGRKKKKSKKSKTLVEESPLFDYLDAMSGASVEDTAEPVKESAEKEPGPLSDETTNNANCAVDNAPNTDWSPAANEDIDADEPDTYSLEIDDDDIPASAFNGGSSPDEVSENESAGADKSEVTEAAAEISSEDVNGGTINRDNDTEQPKAGEDGDESNSVSQQQVNEPTAEKKKHSKYIIPPIAEDDLIFNIVIRRDVLKSYARAYNDIGSQAFSALQKSKRLPIEVVYDDSGVAYLYMFIRAMGTYTYCQLENGMPNTLIAILLSKSIVKICYQPYFLYSMLRLYGIRVSGVYSICSVDKLLHPDAVISPYREYFRIYDAHFKDIRPADTGFPEYDALLVNMQKYILIHAMQTRGSFDHETYAKRHSRDEVLGSSFLRIINLKCNDYLFQLNNDGSIIYNLNYEQLARHDGFFVTYSLSKEDLGELSISDVFLDALYELSIKGRFRKYNIQLVTMASTTMVLFIGESEYELITTALQKYFNRFAQKNNLEKFELTVAHERVYCKTPKSAKRYQIPKNYEQAMDMLITTNDSISVNPDHVVKRSKVKRKTQKEKFDPNK